MKSLFFSSSLQCRFLLFFFLTCSSLCAGDKATVDTFFRSDCELALNQLLAKADKEIRVAVYSFTRFSIANSLIKAHKRGVDVKIVIDKNQVNNKYAKKVLALLKRSGIKVTLLKWGTGHSSMHHKFTVIDKKIVSTGSYNFTSSASSRNAENLIIIHSPKIASKFLREWLSLHENKR